MFSIVLTSNSKLPALNYGGTERVIWDLAFELTKLGNRVYIIAPSKSICDFAEIIPSDSLADIRELIPNTADIIHFFTKPVGNLDLPHVFTLEGNGQEEEIQDIQTIFVSGDQARRHGGENYVYNGLNWNGKFQNNTRKEFHFLGKAAWRKKNVKGAIKCSRMAKVGKLHILGGTRINFSMGFRLTLDLNTKFHGMVNDSYKYEVMQKSRGLIFPVRWNEPFGLSITESLYCGCPVFGTPYGSLPELVSRDVGLLSTNSLELSEAMKDSDNWKPNVCHEYAVENFNSKKMALEYLKIYEEVIGGKVLNLQPPKLIKKEQKLLPFS